MCFFKNKYKYKNCLQSRAHILISYASNEDFQFSSNYLFHFFEMKEHDVFHIKLKYHFTYKDCSLFPKLESPSIKQ